MTSDNSQTAAAIPCPAVLGRALPWSRNVWVYAALVFWLAGCAAAVPRLMEYGEPLRAVWALGYSWPTVTYFFLVLFVLASLFALLAVSVIAYHMPYVFAGWILFGKTARPEPAWFRYISVVFPGIAAALMLYGLIPFFPLVGLAALFNGWWVPALAAFVLFATALVFFFEWKRRSISKKGFPFPSAEALQRLTRINPGDEPLSRMDDIGSSLLWYLTGCTPVSRDEGEIVWAYFGELDPSIFNIIANCTASHPRFVIVPDDLEQRDAVGEAARRYDLWPRFKTPDFLFQPGCHTGFGVGIRNNPPAPGIPEGRVLVVGLRIYHRLQSVRYIRPDAAFGPHIANMEFEGFPGVSTDGTVLEVLSRQGRPAEPPSVFGLVQFRQEGLWHASGRRTFLELPGPEEYAGAAIDGVDGTGALLLRIGDRVHRVPPGITAPKRYDWSGYMLYRGVLCEETVRCWVQGFFLLPQELVRYRLDTPDEPTEPTKEFLPLDRFFNFPPMK
ncbi:MAG: hypothetical protein ACYS8W_16960 [Planctomycetota bacterium]|jgi:hypothetical protein